MTADELAEEFRKAQYVSTDQEIKTFAQITSEDGRREFLAKFWAEIESGRMGRAGILRSVYLQRTLTADQRFHALGRAGWRTDRGRVYVLYAEPDEIERFPSSQDTKPYETWHYYSIENGVDFIFVDRSGFGEYVLVHSTKRGSFRIPIGRVSSNNRTPAGLRGSTHRCRIGYFDDRSADSWSISASVAHHDQSQDGCMSRISAKSCRPAEGG